LNFICDSFDLDAAHNISINFARNENQDTTGAIVSFAVAWT